MPFPYTPYPISGKLYVAGTIQSSKTVTGTNQTLGSTETVTTDSDGSFVIDPANMSNGYANGDVIRISYGTILKDIVIDTTNNPDGKTQDLIESPNIENRIRNQENGASLPYSIEIGA